MKLNLNQIDCHLQLQDFKQYLESAPRMIFSAPFGDGKSYLLQKLKEDEEIKRDYEVFTIYPVNYVVAPNEDVFEYIKRDLIVQLAERHLLDDIDLDALMTSIFSFESFKEIVGFLLTCLPGGGVYKKLFDKLLSIKDKYKEERQTYGDYLSAFQTQRGGLYENDAYSQMIQAALAFIRDGRDIQQPGETRKKSLLVIEDLDRLDPAHLFRILNVISAHLDDPLRPDKVSNKFGFDNIVLVMDYDVTRHVFHHFYGPEASYDGYMSKFLSCEPFRYSIKSSVIPYIRKQIGEVLGIAHLIDTFSHFNTHLTSCSLRDIVKFCDFDTESRVKLPFVVLAGQRFDIHLPIFQLILWMQALGLTQKEIVEDLQNARDQHIVESMTLLYPAALCATRGYFHYFEHNNEVYDIDLNQEADVITSVKILGRVTGRTNPKVPFNNISQFVRVSLQSLVHELNLASIKDN